MLDGWRQEDPATKKKLPVEVDVPEFMVELGRAKNTTELTKGKGDLALVAYYYILRVGEYTKKASHQMTKRTVQFRMKDVAFFSICPLTNRLQLVPPNAPDEVILSADAATLKIENQKNGWKDVCIHQHWNGDKYFCGVRALGRRFVHIRKHCNGNIDTEFSAYWDEGTRYDVRDKDISAGLKHAGACLDYPKQRGISIENIDTHSLRSGGANALALAGYSDTQIQKMGRWRGATFKEYIRNELSVYADGMSKAMKRRFNFVNIAHGTMRDVTATAIMAEPELMEEE